jgi:hypothetical protein
MKKISILIIAFSFFINACKKDTIYKQEPPKFDSLYLKSMVKDNSGFVKIYEGDTTVGGSISGVGNFSRIYPIDIAKAGTVVQFLYVKKRVLQQGDNTVYSYARLMLGVTIPGVQIPNVGTFMGPYEATKGSGGSYQTVTSLVAKQGSTYELSNIVNTSGYTEILDIQNDGARLYGSYNDGLPRRAYSGDYVHDLIPGSLQATALGMKAGVTEPVPNTSNTISIYQGNDSIYAYVYDATNAPVSSTSLPTSTPWVTGNPPTGNANMAFVKSSFNGSKFGFCFHTDQRYVTTLTYDATSNTFTKVLDNVQLPYTGAVTSYDIDENGNLYYSGYAGSGANTGGTSIYKLTPSGATLVGLDNFMNYGTVDIVKYYHGKVYLALSVYKDANGGQVGPKVLFLKQE